MSTTTVPARATTATTATIAIIAIIAGSTSSPSSEALRHEQEGQRGIDGAITADHRPVILPDTLSIASAHHVCRDLARALLVKPVPGCELETAVRPSPRSLETSMEKAADSITTTPAARPSEWRYVNQESFGGGSGFFAMPVDRPRA